MFTKLILSLFFVVFIVGISGCGSIDREKSKLTGKPSQICVDNVLYYQFTSGATVAYNANESIKTC